MYLLVKRLIATTYLIHFIEMTDVVGYDAGIPGTGSANWNSTMKTIGDLLSL